MSEAALANKSEHAMAAPFGALTPGGFERAIIAVTANLPNNWFGLRVAIGLRRLVMSSHEDDFGLDVERWGLHLRLHPRRNGCEKNLLFTPQMYEVPERVELASEIDEGKAAGRPFCFVDIGANVGLFSFFVASRAGPHAKIIAIEPEPTNLSRMRFNLAANPQIPIQVLGLALGENAGRLSLEVDCRDRGGTRTAPLNEHNQATAVECRPLLEVVTRQQLQYIDALKIDVEGAEDKILVPFFLAAPDALWPNLIIIEDTRDLWRTDLNSFLADRGYRVSTRSKLNLMLRRTIAVQHVR